MPGVGHGRTRVVTLDQNSITLWNTETGEAELVLRELQGSNMLGTTISEHRCLIVSAQEVGRVCLWLYSDLVKD